MTPSTDPNNFLFEALDPEDAIKFFRAKDFKFGFAWQDVWQDEHARAFTVAKAMTLDLLKDIREQVDNAIAHGIAFEDFRDNLEPILRARGWWGRAEMVDPLTLKPRNVQLGSYRRLQTIYDTNLRTSYAAGVWQQIQDTKDLLPYLRYVDPDPNPRIEHLAWSGTILKADDDWWDTHTPPNGWNCKCYIDSLGDKDLEREGWQQNAVAPGGGTYTYINPRTGDVSEIPVGIDPGFANNPGKAGIKYAAEQALKGKLAQADNDIADAVERRWPARPAANPTLDEAIEYGRKIAEALPLPAPDDPAAIERWRDDILTKLREKRGTGNVRIKLASNRGKGAKLLRDAASKYPDAWIRKSNELGQIAVEYSQARGYHRPGIADALGHFDSTIRAYANSTAVHELAHRLQSVMPALDVYFEQLHQRRTAGELLEPLQKLSPLSGYGLHEMARKDKYVDPYFGKEYGRLRALEVMPMTYQSIIHGGDYDVGDIWLIKGLLTQDPELLYLGIGLLFSYEP